jgi:YidC/Oxa1 family membrane protein insertase
LDDNRNTLIAILLSVIVLVGWQYFVGMPQVEKQKEAQKQQQQTQSQTQTTAPQPGQPAAPAQPAAPGTPQTSVPQPGGSVSAPPMPGGTKPGVASRDAILKTSPRVNIETPRVRGSIALKGGRIDDLILLGYRETVDPKSANVSLLSPSGTADPFYAEFGWVAGQGTNVKLPNAETVWSAENAGPLTPERPVVLSWDNGEGLKFRRTIAVDANYMFTVSDEVTNSGGHAL